MSFSLYIAKRYLFTKSSNNAINIITGIAATGVVVGALALFIVLSGFGGLKEFSLQFASFFDSDLKVFPAEGKTITFDDTLSSEILKIEDIAAISEVIEERVYLQYKGKNHLASIKGVDANYGNVNPIDSILYFGEWFEPNREEVVIGLAMVSKLSLGTRDYGNLLKLTVPKPGKGQILDPSKAFTSSPAVVSGVYAVNDDLNSKYVFSDVDFARALLSLDSTKVSALEIRLNENADETSTIAALQSLFQNKVIIKTRIQQNDALYKMLNAENLAVYFIFTLILIIALFNVVGSIIMMILDKQSNIKTLFNMGATIKEIRAVFLYQGILMTLIGGVVGVLLGVLVIAAQLQFGLINIAQDLPYPVSLQLKNVIIVLVTITVLGVIASKIASSRVSEKLLH
ncbi:MAG: lipoprotein-releasing system permease protein [Planctomycetota bacterium]|uniref:ABC transporter permease n=1 Tax=Patiriisocius sp. Uisw_047 TaxID=3230969 RepID=UPI0039EA28F2